MAIKNYKQREWGKYLVPFVIFVTHEHITTVFKKL